MTTTETDYTHPDVLTTGVDQGWADPETDPALIDWPARKAAAAIPFEVIDGRPVNPCQSTGVRHGRNQLGRWGENLLADALVTATAAGQRWLLMVERGDGYGWAVPGGHVEPVEDAGWAALRELAKETGLAISLEVLLASEFQFLDACYVPDPRASDEGWAVTIPLRIDLGGGPTHGLPEVTAGDDARQAAWMPAATYGHLLAELADRGGHVFPAHVTMLRKFLDGRA